MVGRPFINGTARLQNLTLIFLVSVHVMLVSCRAADIYPPGMVFIEEQVVPCGQPDHELVYIEVKSFYIDVTEVTNEAYEKFIEADGYEKAEYWSKEGWEWKTTRKVKAPAGWDHPRFSDPKQPVVCVSYYEAEAYAKWAGKRLPTEVEWELAARGTDARYYPWGNEFNGLYANTEEDWLIRLGLLGTGRGLRANDKGEIEPEEARPTRVRSFEKDCSPFGCYDMCGNVAEWCQASKEIPEYTRSPHDFDNPAYAAVRGGCWYASGRKYAKLSRRRFHPKGSAFLSTGFRCAMSYRSEK